ncbi:MAG: cobalt-zinc-cadmium efflux system membrane fusion protein, partial [Pirellulaceae bacterium]
ATEKPAKIAPAHVAHHVSESDLNTITLTEQAERRLDIQLAEVLSVPVQRKRTVGGEVLLPPGQTITVSAPIAGLLSAPPDGVMPTPGSQVEAGQTIFHFKPLLSAERDVLTPAERIQVAQARANVATSKIEAERQIESAVARVEAAQISYDRAAQLRDNKAGSQRTLDEAAVNLKLAEEALITARARNNFLAGIELDERAGELVSRQIASPVSGVLQRLDVVAGETVSAGEALFSVIAVDRVWIRVPIYVGQWREIDTTQSAKVSEFGQTAATAAADAKFVLAPPAADPQAMTVDIHYELDNSDHKLYPGQRLSVSVPLQSRAASLVIPFQAVLYDIHGGAWVYEQTEAHVYVRRRVSVDYVDGESAILAAGPKPGSKVVTAGAAELFGTEFGVGH